MSDFCLSDSCLSVAYIGPNSRTERPRKTKIGTEVAHITRDSDTTLKVKGHQAVWLAVQVTTLIYIDDTIIYATVQSEPLPVDHEYSQRKACWVPQV